VAGDDVRGGEMSELDRAKLDYACEPIELRYHAENPVTEDGRIHVTPELLFAIADRIDELRAEIARLQEKLHDEMSQLEIATDLGNKRWLALNDIYEDGEKHNANWCKRKAQEGLSIK